jgi:hypothetical protein
MGPVTLSGTLTVTGTTTFSGGVTFPSTYDSLVVSVSHLGVGYSPSPAPTTALVMIKGPTADATTYALQVGSSLFVRNDGFVGIGTATPGPYPSVTFAPKFQVNGTTFISSSGALILGPSIFTGATYSNQTTCTAANTGQISLDLLGNLCSCVNSQWTRVDGTTQCTTNTNTTTQSLCEAAGGTYLAQSSSATCRSNQNCTCTNTTAPCTAATTSTCNCSGAPMCQFVAPNMTLDNGSTDSAAYQYTKGTCPTGWIQVGKYAAYDNITHCDDSISGNNCCVPGTDSGDPDSTNFATGKGWSPDGPPLPNCVINNWGFKACSSASQNCPATTTQVIPTMTKIGCVQTSTTINANQSKASYIKCRNAPLGTPMLNPAATAATDEGVTPTYICRFNASTCPDSFTQYLNWTTTSEGTADAGSSTNCAGVHSYCHTGYHPWANTAPETCTAQQINICGGVGTNNDHNATGHASITQIGCQ